MLYDEKTSVVRDLNSLIETYGINKVAHALRYISEFPKTVVERRFPNLTGADWYLSEDEFRRVDNTDPKVNKIKAIKMFREITSCGLKEAKDAIEGYYNIPPVQWT